ncbi:MAG: hypothetical protein OXH32_12565 [Acidobacteria bacterium]|nr:hypothetical protein [Acidobacteriota bacterium]
MKIKTVTNEADYDEAQEAVDRLMGAAAGTPEGNESKRGHLLSERAD